MIAVAAVQHERAIYVPLVSWISQEKEGILTSSSTSIHLCSFEFSPGFCGRRN
jgi:hypothetical protein